MILRRKESLGEISVSSITILREISIGLRVPESQKLLFLHIRSKNPIYEDRENFPQVEMPPAFAIWFYADPVKSKSQTVESRVPKLLALTAAEQMACLRDTTKANCGEIRDFVRETATWGGAESVKPFKFLIRPMTRKPPDWKSSRQVPGTGPQADRWRTCAFNATTAAGPSATARAWRGPARASRGRRPWT